MYVYIYIHTHIYILTYTHTHICARTYVRPSMPYTHSQYRQIIDGYLGTADLEARMRHLDELEVHAPVESGWGVSRVTGAVGCQYVCMYIYMYVYTCCAMKLKCTRLSSPDGESLE